MEVENGGSISWQALMKSTMIQSLVLLAVFEKFEGWNSEVERSFAFQDHLLQLLQNGQLDNFENTNMAKNACIESLIILKSNQMEKIYMLKARNMGQNCVVNLR